MIRAVPGFHWKTKPPLGAKLDKSHPFANAQQMRFLLNEGQGQSLTDQYGNSVSYSGTKPTWAAGRNGSCLSFSGAGCMQIPSTPAFVPGTASFAVSAWIWAANAAQKGPFFTKRNTSSFVQFQVGVGTCISGSNAAGQTIYIFTLSNPGTVETEYHTTANVIDGNWHWVVVQRIVAGSTATYAIYVDGQSMALTAGNAGTSPGNLNNTDPLTIGGNDANLFFTGLMDDCRFWNRALFPSEIAQMYANQYIDVFAPATRRIFKYGSSIPRSLFSRVA